MPQTTVSGVLTRSAWAGSAAGDQARPARSRSRPGELIHIDVKKLGRIEGGYGERIAARLQARRAVWSGRRSVPKARRQASEQK